MSTTDRVAVVVVHGIADPRAAQTVREIARLLCHGGAGEPRYAQGEMHEVLVPVAKDGFFSTRTGLPTARHRSERCRGASLLLGALSSHL